MKRRKVVTADPIEDQEEPSTGNWVKDDLGLVGSMVQGTIG